jgi:DNA polymerase elongation subunit (family B)
MTGKKSNTPVYVQNCFKEVTAIIKEYYTDVKMMRQLITETITKYAMALDFREFNPLDMKKTVKLGTDLFRYKVEGQHVKAAKKLVRYLKKKLDDKSIPDHIIVPKDTYIDFVIETAGRNKRTPTPVEMIENNKKIDVNYYKESLVKTLSQVLKPLNIGQEQFLIDHRKQTLTDWF